MTTIIFQRSGGILGKELQRDIDLNELPDSESQGLMQLLAEANFFKIPQNLIDHAVPDEYEYTLTVESGNTNHTVHTSESTAPEPLHRLLEKLTALANEDSSDTLNSPN